MVLTENGVDTHTWGQTSMEDALGGKVDKYYPEEGETETHVSTDEFGQLIYRFSKAQRLFTLESFDSAEKNYRVVLEDKNPVYSYTEKQISEIRIPHKWVKQNVEEPNFDCKVKSIEICRELFDNYQIIPRRISATIEGGIFLSYDSPKDNNRTLVIEVYNNLEIAAIVTENKKMMISSDIYGNNFQEIIESLYAS